MPHIQSNPTHPTFHILSEEQVQAIHQASLQILEQTGIDLKDPQARDLLLANGARLGGRGRVHIPAHLVQDALYSAPGRISLHDRLGNLTMPLVLGNVFFGPGSDTIYTIDVETGERRHALGADIRQIARLCDALPNISFVMSMGTPWDAPRADTYLHCFIEMLRGTTKPLVFTAMDLRDLEHIWRIAVQVAGSEDALRQKPFLLNYSEPISPLLFAPDPVQKLMFCAEKGIPVTFPPSPNLGGGGPVTLAGSLALGNAEILAGLVIHQLTARGAPFLYGANHAAMDMRTMVVCYGSPEWSMGNAALTDMARKYGLPVWGYGGASDSKVVDAQAGLEAMLSIYSAYLSRATLVHDVGYIESGLTSSMEMIAIVDEIIDMVRHIVDGITVDTNTLALDAIDRAMPGGGFLADEHTLQNYRTALFTPRLIDRQRFDRWEKAGSKDLYQRTNQYVRDILSKHSVAPLEQGVEAEIETILQERAQS